MRRNRKRDRRGSAGYQRDFREGIDRDQMQGEYAEQGHRDHILHKNLSGVRGDKMTIYIDNDYKCHTSPGEGLTAIETDAFDDECTRFIEGYRFVPADKSWTREDSQVFHGEMVAPWRDYTILSEFQEVAQEEQAKATKEIATIVEEVYNSDMEVISNV